MLDGVCWNELCTGLLPVVPLGGTFPLESQGPPDVSPLGCPQSPVSSLGGEGEGAALSCLTLSFLNLQTAQGQAFDETSQTFFSNSLGSSLCQSTIWLPAGKRGHTEARSTSGCLGGRLAKISKITNHTVLSLSGLLCLVRQTASCRLELCVLVLPTRPAAGCFFGKYL